MLPAVANVIGALVAPAGIRPVSKPLPVAVWAMLSALRQATVWPTFTLPGFGENDVSALMLLIVIVTSAVAAATVGVVATGVTVGFVP
jgi:hypothetical protein